MSLARLKHWSCRDGCWRRLLPLTTLLAGLGGLFLAALGRLQGLIGDWALYFDAISHLSGHLIGMAAASALAIALPRRTLAILGLGAAATLGGHALLAQGGAMVPTAQASAAPGDLRVFSINTWHANPDHAKLLDVIQGSQADVLVLIEFGPNKRHLLDALRPQFPYQADCASQWHCSMAIVSRRPWLRATTAARVYRRQADGVKMSPPMAEAVFATTQGPLTVIGAHLFRPIDSPRGHMREIHALADRARQAQALGPGAGVIVVGDFNATPWSQSFREFGQLSGLQHMGRFLPSWPAGPRGLPQLAIDHLWVSETLQIRQVGLGPDVASDHRPLGAVVSRSNGGLQFVQ